MEHTALTFYSLTTCFQKLYAITANWIIFILLVTKFNLAVFSVQELHFSDSQDFKKQEMINREQLQARNESSDYFIR